MIALLALKLMERGLGPKLAKLSAWAIVLIAAALLIGAAVWWFTDTVDGARKDGVKQGATTERVEAQGKVIENVQAANETRAAVRNEHSRAAYDECLRSARNPTNCQRFMPE